MKKIVISCLLLVGSSRAMYLDPSLDQTSAYDIQLAQRVACVDGCIEPYQAKRDFAVVAHIIKTYPQFLIHHQSKERLLDILSHTSVPTIAVYRVQGVTVGFVNVVLVERNLLWFTKRYTVLAGIGVAPEQQGHGYGNILLDYAIAISKEKLRVSRLELEVHQDNKKALAWYQSKGFVIDAYGADGWISCSLHLVTNKRYRSPIVALG